MTILKRQERLNPCELEIDLFCRGAQIEASIYPDLKLAPRTRAGLGSGLELVIPGSWKDIRVNVPVAEEFAQNSPYHLRREDQSGEFHLLDRRSGERYHVRISAPPHWYQKRTSRGRLMGQIGILQGTCLGIYIGPVCRYWSKNSSLHCSFCTTGLNVGVREQLQKSVKDVVETSITARDESGVTFVHLNTGYQEGRELAMALPFVRAIKNQTGMLVGLQTTPVQDLTEYDELVDLGVDHFSFCFEFMNESDFQRHCPGKAKTLGQSAFLKAMEYTAQKLGKGRVSGEIIAGLEPVDATLRAIDLITDYGAFPTVCIFRPLAGSDLSNCPPPSYTEMRVVFEYMIESCRKKGIPIGVAPNVETSLVVQATDALYLVDHAFRWYRYRFYNRLMSTLVGQYVRFQISQKRKKGTAC